MGFPFPKFQQPAPLQWEGMILNANLFMFIQNNLAHKGLIIPWYQVNSLWPSYDYGYLEILGQHWFRYWLLAWQHQAITWTTVDLASTRSSGIHSRVMFTWVHKEMCLKFTYSKSEPHLPGDNELIGNNPFLTECKTIIFPKLTHRRYGNLSLHHRYAN